jgi:hypothetical protein
MGDDRRGRAMGQALVHGEGLVGGREHLAHGGVHQVGQALTAEFLGHVDGGPAAFLHLVEGGLEARGRVDDAVFQRQPSVSPTGFSGASTSALILPASSRMAAVKSRSRSS